MMSELMALEPMSISRSVSVSLFWSMIVGVVTDVDEGEGWPIPLAQGSNLDDVVSGYASEDDTEGELF